MIIEKGDVFNEQIELSEKQEDKLMWVTVGLRKNQSAIKIDKEDAIKIVVHLTQQFEL